MKTCIILIVIAIFCFSIPAYSQSDAKPDSSDHFSAGADLVSRYIWRGSALSKSAAFQPTMSFSAGNFNIGAWGSYTFGYEQLQEADLFMSYSLGIFSITINDYYNPDDSIEGGYFDWRSKTTRHTLEGVLTIDGPESFPFQFLAGVYFYGNDRDSISENYYSTYLELNRTWESGNYSIKPFIGISPFTGAYSSDGFQVVNLGVTFTKSLKLGTLTELPINVSFITNPYKENVYIVFGLTF